MSIEKEDLIIFIIKKEMLEMTKIKKSSLPKYIEEEGFPRPVPGTTRTQFWILGEVQAWMRSRRDIRDKETMRQK